MDKSKHGLSSPRRLAVITGASTGSGEATALHLDRIGFHVFAGVRKTSDQDRLRAKASFRLTPIYLDVTESNARDAAAAQVLAALRGQDSLALVSNAGIVVAGPLEFLPLEAFRAQLEVNLVGQLAVAQAFLPLLRRYHGRLVLMSSINGLFSPPMLGPYSASKFGVEALADALRVELMPWQIPVSLIEPGSVNTGIWDKGLAEAEHMAEQLPPEASRYYGPIFAKQRQRAESRKGAGIPAERVATEVARALTSRNPKPRYLVGRDAHLLALFARWLPDRWRDKLLARLLGFTSAGLL